ncbi:hypothetical protein PS467_00745 [Streptomyces luomodiensis]|uniref:Lipoyl-binding domain-containing protein n=1 Tax=Streptomyces luomodiensis TaxID=3026192 RepID=A0ABY9UN34_9ACTN|nr:hypothetical protein [Streptomyces sp. SCA4-21]WNE93953.1 hypothetical protein PS467_00745 [Streptomyces sp. SCA4-21]
MTAPFDGTVTELRVAPDATVVLDEVLAVVEPAKAGPGRTGRP